uniref:Uncharacterized protein n=1 Tax=Lepeophtheirus salmonis TaxID=72036 RepID=A0A0K2T3V7_LEPSM
MKYCRRVDETGFIYNFFLILIISSAEKLQ